MLPACAAAVAAAVRLPGVFGQALSQDEVASARILREPGFGAMLARVARTESTPPLWYTLAWFVHRVGISLTDVRLLSVFAGCGLAAAVVAAGRYVLPDGAALLAGLLVAVGNEFVVHGHELRAYELLSFFSAVFLWLLLRELAAPSRANAIGLGTVVAAGGLTHYFFAPVALAALIWVVGDPAGRACRRAVLIAVASGGAVAAAWAPVMLVQYHRDRFWWIGPFELRPIVAAPLRLFTLVWADTSPGLALSIASLAVLAVGCWALGRSGRAGRLVVALAVGPLGIAAALWAVGAHVFALRNMIELGPPVALIAGAFVVRVAERAGVAAAFVVAGIVLVLPFGQAAGSVPPFGGIAHALVAEGWRPSDPLAVFGNFFVYRAPLEWYLPGSPRLDAARPRTRACRAVFVVADDRLPRRLDAHVVREVSSDGYVVARLAFAAPRLRGATLLDDPAAASGCVRPIRTGRLAPIA
jgi:Dolichyl-phosphate-mannose-protein mannosyltransferase